VLQFNGTNWVPAASSGSSVSFIDDLSDVVVSGVVSGQLLGYDGTNWVPRTRPVITTGLLSARPTTNLTNGQIYIVSGETVASNRLLNGRTYIYSTATTSWVEVTE
jgi:hypothetical protein